MHTPWVLFPTLYKCSQLTFFLTCPTATFHAQPVSTNSCSPLSGGKPGGQWCSGDAQPGPGAIREGFTKEEVSNSRSLGVRNSTHAEGKEGVLDEKKQPVQKAKKATKWLSLVSLNQMVAQMKEMWHTAQWELRKFAAELRVKPGGDPGQSSFEYANTRGSDAGEA